MVIDILIYIDAHKCWFRVVSEPTTFGSVVVVVKVTRPEETGNNTGTRG